MAGSAAFNATADLEFRLPTRRVSIAHAASRDCEFSLRGLLL
jgi:hypothetical protein